LQVIKFMNCPEKVESEDDSTSFFMSHKFAPIRYIVCEEELHEKGRKGL